MKPPATKTKRKEQNKTKTKTKTDGKMKAQELEASDCYGHNHDDIPPPQYVKKMLFFSHQFLFLPAFCGFQP